MKQALLICDLYFSDGQGPLRATGTNEWEMMASVGMTGAKDKGIIITNTIWIAWTSHNEQEGPQKATEQPRRVRVSEKRLTAVERKWEAWSK